MNIQKNEIIALFGSPLEKVINFENQKPNLRGFKPEIQELAIASKTYLPLIERVVIDLTKESNLIEEILKLDKTSDLSQFINNQAYLNDYFDLWYKTSPSSLIANYIIKRDTKNRGGHHSTNPVSVRNNLVSFFVGSRQHPSPLNPVRRDDTVGPFLGREGPYGGTETLGGTLEEHNMLFLNKYSNRVNIENKIFNCLIRRGGEKSFRELSTYANFRPEKNNRNRITGTLASVKTKDSSTSTGKEYPVFKKIPVLSYGEILPIGSAPTLRRLKKDREKKKARLLNRKGNRNRTPPIYRVQFIRGGIFPIIESRKKTANSKSSFPPSIRRQITNEKKKK